MLIAAALCIIPFVLVHQSIKNNRNELVSGLKSVAASYNSDISTYDCGIDFSIGISSAKNFIFFYKKKSGVVIEECIPLIAISKCQIESAKKNPKTKKVNGANRDKLVLTFIPKDNNVIPSRLTFFDPDEHFSQNGELPLIRKWESITNETLSL